MAAEWREVLDVLLMRSSELFSSVREDITALLRGGGGGGDHTGLVVLSSAALGLLIALLLWLVPRRDSSRIPAEKSAPDPGNTVRPRAEENKKRNRRRGGKLQRNDLVDLVDLVDLEDEPRPSEAQDHNEGPDAAGGKSDKAKKNKKKIKAAAKEPKTSSSLTERKEQEEVGSWETKVSHREKRQQKKKDKGAGEERAGEESPGPAQPGARAAVSNPEPSPATEEPQITPVTKSSTTQPSRNSKANKNANTPTPAMPKKDVPAVDTPVAPAAPAAGIPPVELVSHVWDDVLTRPPPPDSFSGASVPASNTWTNVTLNKPQPSVWPQDMEGSWTIVDSSHIPVSFHGVSAGEPAFVPDMSWACRPPVDDEWSGLNSVSVDLVSDWSAPCEEWGNFGEAAGGAPHPPHLSHPEEPQESDPEKDEAAAPGKGKKKKKKKKKVDETGTPPTVDVSIRKVQNSAGAMEPKSAKVQNRVAVLAPPPREVQKPAEPEAPPLQKTPEESWDSPKQVKKKKARRET